MLAIYPDAFQCPEQQRGRGSSQRGTTPGAELGKGQNHRAIFALSLLGCRDSHPSQAQEEALVHLQLDDQKTTQSASSHGSSKEAMRTAVSTRLGGMAAIQPTPPQRSFSTVLQGQRPSLRRRLFQGPWIRTGEFCLARRKSSRSMSWDPPQLPLLPLPGVHSACRTVTL